MTKSKNIAPSESNRIKSLEAKMNKNIAGVMPIQTELVWGELKRGIKGIYH